MHLTSQTFLISQIFAYTTVNRRNIAMFSKRNDGVSRNRRNREPFRTGKQTGDAQNKFLSDDAVDSFLAGDYAYPFSESAPAPHPLLSPGETVDLSLRALRELDEPYPSHGAAVFLRFCIPPLTRGEKLGGDDPWKDILRSSLTAAMFARNLRASPLFSCLLDWNSLDVTEGASNPTPSNFIPGKPNDISYVNAGLFFEGGAPVIVHFRLKKLGEAWFIDTVINTEH